MSMDDPLPGGFAKPGSVEPRHQVQPHQAELKPVARGRQPARVDSPGSNPLPPWVAKVEIYTRRFCADSMRTKGIFDRKHIQYNEYLIDNEIGRAHV